MPRLVYLVSIGCSEDLAGSLEARLVGLLGAHGTGTHSSQFNFVARNCSRAAAAGEAETATRHRSNLSVIAETKSTQLDGASNTSTVHLLLCSIDTF